MNTEVMTQFDVLDMETLEMIEGGKNNWQENLKGGGGALVAGWGLGVTICSVSGVGAGFAPICGAAGAKLVFAAWTGATAATGGF